MAGASEFKQCNHTAAGKEPVRDWRECFQCIGEVQMQLVIARAYLEEIAKADFNENGDCVKPFKEPVQGRSYQQIAATGFGAAQ